LISRSRADQIRNPVASEPHPARKDRPSSDAPDWAARGFPAAPFAAKAVRLQLHALAHNLGNFLRTLATPESIKDWSLTSLKEKLIKIGAKLVSHGRYVAFQRAEVAVPRTLFADILRLIAELRPAPAASTA
jgi:hypothetical protein